MAWDPNTESDLAGYRIYYGNANKDYSFTVDVGNHTSYKVLSLEEDKIYYFAATAYDINGNESDFSDEVTYTVPISNNPPLTNDNTLTTTENTIVTGTLSATDPDGDDLTFSLVTTGSIGTAALTNANTGAFTYTPNPNTTATDTFTFKANDGKVDSNVATVTITITSVGDKDGDGIADDEEIDTYGTNPSKADTDGDGINDGEELALWGDNWDADDDGDGLINLLDPDADGDGFSDGLEIYYGFDPADPGSRPQVPLLEMGEVRVDHNWKQVEFTEPFMDPVVLAKPLSLNGGHPAVVRIRNVDRSGFEIRVQEWEYLDGEHTMETISYLVMERGSYTLGDGIQVEAGRFETSKTNSFGAVAFSQSFQRMPVVVTAVSTFNEEDTVTGRVRNVSTEGFEFRMQEQELNSQGHTTETVSYIAWEPSSGILDGLTFEVNRTEDIVQHDFHTILFNETFLKIPVFLADMQTTDGGNTANLRWKDRDLYGVDVQIDEEQSRDDEVGHTTEVVGYLLFAKDGL